MPETGSARVPSEPPALDATGAHLGVEEIYALIEQRLTRRKLQLAEAHLDSCAECVETLAMVLRAERPATRDEQEILAAMKTEVGLLDALRTDVASSTPPGTGRTGIEWNPVIIAILTAVSLFFAGLILHNRYWLPASSRLAASRTIEAMVKLRQGTGRLPLRYITEFERAGIVRSGFDTTDEQEEALIANLRAAYERAPEPEAAIALGLLLLDNGQLQEAEELLLRGREARPQSVDAINGLAVLFYQKAEYFPDEAHSLLQRGLALLRQAERIDPGDLRVLFNYGRFYDALEMRAAAAKAFTRYLENDGVSQWSEVAAQELSRITPAPSAR